MNFGGTIENVVIRDEFPLEKAREVLKNETIAVIGYGVQGNLPSDEQTNINIIHERRLFIMNQTTDKWSLGGHEFTSRFILGSGKFSLDLVKACVENAGTEIVTLAIRRANEGGLANILDYIPENVTLLPNTSGARTAAEAVRTAKLSRVTEFPVSPRSAFSFFPCRSPLSSKSYSDMMQFPLRLHNLSHDF